MANTSAEIILKQKTYDRTLEWNEAGWDGSGIHIWNRESAGDSGSHGTMSTKRVITAAPNATVYNATHCFVMDKGGIKEEHVTYNGETMSGEEFINKYDISILTESHSGASIKDKKLQAKIDYFTELKNKYNLSLFNSAGNDGSEGVQGGALPEMCAMYVGACTLGPQGTPVIAKYSSWGDEFEEVDFTHFVGNFSGTSFSCPYLAGIAALLQQRYGLDITHDEIYTYFKMCAQIIDTGHMMDEKYDYISGYGIPILPHVDKKYIRMTIGSKFYKVDGETEEMDTAPFIKDRRTFVPIAFIALALGAEVRWDGNSKKVTIIKDGTVLEMYIGKTSYMVNGKPYTMDTAPFIKDSRTFVPIAFVALALNCKVAWCAEEAKVMILEQ